MTREALFRSHEGLARRLAKDYWRGIRAVGLQPDDIRQMALVGLWAAVRCYDPAHGVPFEPYARCRIRGYIEDGIRTQRKKARLGPLAEIPLEGGDGPPDAAERRDRVARLWLAVAELPKPHRDVVRCRLAGGLLREAGAAIGVSESRACQLEREAVAVLRGRLGW